MSTRDKTEEQLLASVRQTRNEAQGKEAAKAPVKKAATKKKAAAAKKAATKKAAPAKKAVTKKAAPKATKTEDRPNPFQRRNRRWPD